MTGQAEMLTVPVPLNSHWPIHVFSLGIVLPILATSIVALRFLARWMRVVSPSLDDWLILAALILFFFHSLVIILTVSLGGSGHNISKLSPDVLVNQLKLFMVFQITYALTVGLINSSILMIYKRIFKENMKLVKIVRIILVAVVCWVTMAILIALASCRPFSYNWNKHRHGHCGNLRAGVAAVAVIDTVIDLCTVLILVPRLPSASLSAQTMATFAGASILGLFNFAAGSLRVVFALRIDFSDDWTYSLAKLYFWSMMKPGMAFVVACVPVLRFLHDKFVVRSRRPQNPESRPGSAHLQSRRRSDLLSGDTLADLDFQGQTLSTATTLVGTDLGEPPQISSHEFLQSEPDDEESSARVVNVRRDITVEEETAQSS